MADDKRFVVVILEIRDEDVADVVPPGIVVVIVFVEDGDVGVPATVVLVR